MLKERGLPHTGKKAELVQRLEEPNKTISQAEGPAAAAEAQKVNTVSLEHLDTLCA